MLRLNRSKSVDISSVFLVLLLGCVTQVLLEDRNLSQHLFTEPVEQVFSTILEVLEEQHIPIAYLDQEHHLMTSGWVFQSRNEKYRLSLSCVNVGEMTYLSLHRYMKVFDKERSIWVIINDRPEEEQAFIELVVERLARRNAPKK